MARRGRGAVASDRRARTNPIDGRRVADACAGASAADFPDEISIGGPHVRTRGELACLALQSARKASSCRESHPDTERHKRSSRKAPHCVREVHWSCACSIIDHAMHYRARTTGATMVRASMMAVVALWAQISSAQAPELGQGWVSEYKLAAGQVVALAEAM